MKIVTLILATLVIAIILSAIKTAHRMKYDPDYTNGKIIYKWPSSGDTTPEQADLITFLEREANKIN